MPPNLVARLAPIVYCTPRRESETNGGAEPEVQRLEEPSAEDGTRACKKVPNTRGAQEAQLGCKCVQRARSANAGRHARGADGPVARPGGTRARDTGHRRWGVSMESSNEGPVAYALRKESE